VGKEPSTDGFSPQGLAWLLRMGIDEDRSDCQEETFEGKAELLDAFLAGPLPPDSVTADALPTLVARLCQELLPLGGRSIESILLDPSVDMATLKKVKDYGKRMASRKRSDSEHAAAVAVYYAAIAAAMVYHGQKITSHSLPYLRSSFKELAGAAWVGTKLSQLLDAAKVACG